MVNEALNNAGKHTARGVLHKSEPAETILRAIQKVSASEIWLKAALLGEVMGRLTGHYPAPAKGG